MLTWFIFGLVGWGLPFLIMRKKGGRGRGVVAYLVGFIVTFIATFGALWYLEEVAHIVPLQANHVIGPGMWAALLGPALGLWTAKRVRAAKSVGSDS